MKIQAYQGKYNVSGDRIRQLRTQKRMSQEQLAAKLQLAGVDTSQKTISRVEMGARAVPDYELAYYARVLDTTVLWLLGLETDDSSVS